MISGIGARSTFLIFGILSVVDLILFVLVNVLHDKCCPDGQEEDRILGEYTALERKPCCQN